MVSRSRLKRASGRKKVSRLPRVYKEEVQRHDVLLTDIEEPETIKRKKLDEAKHYVMKLYEALCTGDL